MLIALPALVTGCGGGSGGYGGEYEDSDFSNDSFYDGSIDEANNEKRPDDWNYDEGGDRPIDDYYPSEFDYDGYEPEYP